LNLGTPVAGNALAGELREGASLLLDVGPHFTLLTALAGAWAPGGVGSAQGGLEGVLEGQWALRLGYQLPFYNNLIEGFSGLTAGAGFKISSLALDYAYLPFGSLGTSHRVSLSYQFDLPKEVVRVAVPVQVPVTVVQPVAAPETPAKDVEVHFKISNDPLAQGMALEKQGKPKEAVKAYIQELRQNPGNHELWSALGRVYYQLREKAYAVHCFEKALEIKQDSALADWLGKYKSQSDSP
jgi:tetratricopeptide (TPR) repeat protein